MHVPNLMLNGAVCPVTAALAIGGVGLAAFAASRIKEKPTAIQMGAVAALVFAAQMMNFPVQDGTSGHFLGATLASALLGTPFGILVMAAVLAIQAIVFADGGLTVLGANILNMALIGSLLGGGFRLLVKSEDRKSPKSMLILALASWLSVVAASSACSLELAVSGTIAGERVFPAMLSVHALIGLGEAMITVAAFLLLAPVTSISTKKHIPLLILGSAALVALVGSPFASSFPDGLEWVAEKYRFLHESAPLFVHPLPDYTVPALADSWLSTSLAGLIGVVVSFGLSWGIGQAVVRRNRTA